MAKKAAEKKATEKKVDDKKVDSKAPAKKEDEKKGKEEATTKPSKDTKMTVLINWWRTRLHSEELGVYQALKYRAKSKQFKPDFDIEGVVEFDGAKKYVIAYNKKAWHDSKVGDPAKRLTIRLFTIMEEGVSSELKGGNYIGGIELSIAHSIIQSFEVKEASPVFFIQTPSSEFLTPVMSSYRLAGTRWVFPLLPEQEADKLQLVVAKGVIGLGRDYDIYVGKKKVAKVDSVKTTKDVIIEIYDDQFAKDKIFVLFLTLFGLTAWFMKECEDMIGEITKKMEESGTSDYKIPHYELKLFRNPRMMRTV